MTYSPLTRIRLVNFQSHVDSIIELDQLTVLVGPGDAGKSSVLRGLRAAVLNDGDDTDIRYGEKRCEVELTFEDGTVILWYKEKSKGGCYKWGDVEYTKTGGRVPDDIAKFLGISIIEVSSTLSLTPQLSDQHDQPFLLWETGSARSKILGAATRLNVVVNGQMLCNKAIKGHKKEIKLAEEELERVDTELESLPDYAALELQVQEAKDTLGVLQKSMEIVSRVRDLEAKIGDVKAQTKAIDVTAARTKLEEAERGLAAVTNLDRIYKALPVHRKEIADLEKRLEDTRIAAASFKEQYEDACREKGVCPGCKGLRDHTECAI